MIFLRIERFWVKKKISKKNFLAIFQIFEPPKKPKKWKFRKNEKNDPRYFPKVP